MVTCLFFSCISFLISFPISSAIHQRLCDPMLPFHRLFLLLFTILPNVCLSSKQTQILNGQIVPEPTLTSFAVTVNCADCEKENYEKFVAGRGAFQIAMRAKEGEQIGRIAVKMESLSTLGKMNRSFGWIIEEPSSDKIYKFFTGHFTPHPVYRLSLHGRFVGELPVLSGPNTFYSIRLKKLDTDNSSSANKIDQRSTDQSLEDTDQNIFSEIFAYGQDKDSWREWTGDKGFVLRLNRKGVDYLRDNGRPSMELQLVTVEIELSAHCAKTPQRNAKAQKGKKKLRDNLSPFGYYQSAEYLAGGNNQRKNLADTANLSPYSYYQSEKPREKGVDAETNAKRDDGAKSEEPFGATWLGKMRGRTNNGIGKGIGIGNAAVHGGPRRGIGGSIPNVLQGGADSRAESHLMTSDKHRRFSTGTRLVPPPGRNAVVDHSGHLRQQTLENVAGGDPIASTVIHGRTVPRPNMARNLGRRAAEVHLGEEEEDEQKPTMCCFLPKMSFKKRASSECGSAASSPAKSAAAASSEDNVSSAGERDWPSTMSQMSQSQGSPTSNAGPNLHTAEEDNGTANANTEKWEEEKLKSENKNKKTTNKKKNKKVEATDGEKGGQTGDKDSDWHATDASPIHGADQRATLRRMRNRGPTSAALSGASSSTTAERRQKRGVHDQQSEYSLWSISGSVPQHSQLFHRQQSSSARSSSSAAQTATLKEVLLSVRIEMPVLMNHLRQQGEEGEQDYFMYTFKLPPPNKIEADEVNRQQVRAEMKPIMPTARSVSSSSSRSNMSKAASPAASRTSSNSSMLSNSLYSDPKMAKAFHERHLKALQMKEMREKKRLEGTQEQNVQLDSPNGKKVQKMKQHREPDGGKDVPKTEAKTEGKMKKPKQRKETPRKAGEEKPGQSQTKGERSPNDRRKSQKASMDSERNSETTTNPIVPSKHLAVVSKAKQEEEEDMDQIWERIKPNQQQRTEEGRKSGREEEEMGESSRKDSAMLREIKQKMGKLNKVSPKRGGKAEEMTSKQKKLEGSDDLGRERGELEGTDQNEAIKGKDGDRENEYHPDHQKRVVQKQWEEKSSDSTTANAFPEKSTDEGMASYDAMKHKKTDHSDQENEVDFDLPFMDQELLKELKGNKEYAAFLKSIEQEAKQQQNVQQLNLDLSKDEIAYVKQYLEKEKIEEELDPIAQNNVINIALILSDWLDQKPNAFEGLSVEQIAKLNEILLELYPSTGDANHLNTTIISEAEESEAEPLIRRRKSRIEGKSDAGGDDNSLGQVGVRATFAQTDHNFSYVEQNEPFGEASNSPGIEEDDFCESESPVEVYRHENLFRMVEEDIEAIKSDAESRAQLGNELQKLCQKKGAKEQKCQTGLAEEIEHILQNISEEELDLLKAELEKIEMERGKTESLEGKAAPNEVVEQQGTNARKFLEKPPKAKRANLESDIDIRTDSELHKKRQPKMAYRLKASVPGNKHQNGANVEQGQNANEGVKSANLNEKEKDEKTIGKTMDQPTEHGQTTASYFEWKNRQKNSERGAAAVEAHEEEGFEGFYTPKPSPNVFTLKETPPSFALQKQQPSAGFLSRQIERLSSVNNWFRGMVAKSDAEQEPEQQGYLEQLAKLISTELDAREGPPHGLEEDTDDATAAHHGRA